MDVRLIAVALPLPLAHAFTYRVPASCDLPERGVRVVVPFGPRRMIGVVLGPTSEGAKGIKDIHQILDESPLVPPPLMDLALWIADYYMAPPGECLRLIYPPEGIRASRAVARLTAPEEESTNDAIIASLRQGARRVTTLTNAHGERAAARLNQLKKRGLVSIEQDLTARGYRQAFSVRRTEKAIAARGKAQQEVLSRLDARGGQALMADLMSDRPSLRAALMRLKEMGAVVLSEVVATPYVDDCASVAAGESRIQINLDQQAALERVQTSLREQCFRPFLLHGVTGSGKTEVYFRAAEEALAMGRGVLMLVPEIALTPMLVRLAARRFGQTVAVLHSDLSRAERHAQWWRIRESEARIVIGARSAVFAPVHTAGLIIVDEEHEASYKQEESPRYHARDAAVMRAKIEGATILLGSATPSLESYQNARAGKYELLRLPKRVNAGLLPQVAIVDRRLAIKEGGNPILTPQLQQAIDDRLQRNEQIVLLLNRRGYATSLVCKECGGQAYCENCTVTLTLHRVGRQAVCHYCGFEKRVPETCAACGGAYLQLTGYGTERVVEAVGRAFPTARIARLDRDVAARRRAVAETLTDFDAGRLDILIGTQMVAKGHDFPRVTLVGVIDADVGLGLPDFRSAERTFELLTQVAGRSGRGEIPGQVVLQSHLPDHYALEMACAQDYERFFEREMEFRRTMGYPPVAALVNLIVRSRDPQAAGQHASTLASALRQTSEGRYRVLGPAAAPIARLKQEHRVQILIKGPRAILRAKLPQVLRRREKTKNVVVTVDVDPMSIM